MASKINTYGNILKDYLQADNYGLFVDGISYEDLKETEQTVVWVCQNDIVPVQDTSCYQSYFQYNINIYTVEEKEQQHFQKLEQILQKARQFRNKLPAIYAKEVIVSGFIGWDGTGTSLVLKSGVQVNVYEG